MLDLSDDELRILYRACAGHTGGVNPSCDTIACCWDADRLDIRRVGIELKLKFFNTEKARETGLVNFTKPSSLPSDFVAYDKLDEATVLGWVKTAIGADDVAAIEKVIEDNIAIINTPVTATGKPF